MADAVFAGGSGLLHVAPLLLLALLLALRRFPGEERLAALAGPHVPQPALRPVGRRRRDRRRGRDRHRQLGLVFGRHGYDVHKDVEAGGSAHFKFPARITGEFVVELEDHKQTLANVTVNP